MRTSGGRAGITLLAALLVAVAPALAQHPDIDAAWRSMFRREWVPPSPPGNPLEPGRTALGARLFSDPRLSGHGQRSCASCHVPERAFTDGRRRPLSLSGTPLPRNTPSLWNLGWSKHYFWDGRVETLEEQVALPIEAADEMAGEWPVILARLGADAGMAAAFKGAFADEPPLSRRTVLAALAAHVRSLVSPRTRFDDWVDGDERALGPGEVRGFRLFTGKAGCVLCHVGWRFTDDRFHDIGLPGSDPGRGAVAGGTPGLSAFKTPSLRELAGTAPYMHDGSLPDLAAVVRHYAGGLVRRPSLSTHINRDLSLTAAEIADLIAFLATLSSDKKPTLPR